MCEFSSVHCQGRFTNLPTQSHCWPPQVRSRCTVLLAFGSGGPQESCIHALNVGGGHLGRKYEVPSSSDQATGRSEWAPLSQGPSSLGLKCSLLAGTGSGTNHSHITAQQSNYCHRSSDTFYVAEPLDKNLVAVLCSFMLLMDGIVFLLCGKVDKARIGTLTMWTT